MAVRDQNQDVFNRVILFLGGFHLADNYLMAICKFMGQSGEEDILLPLYALKEQLRRFLDRKQPITEEAYNPSLGNIQLYLGGGFQEENKTIRISEESVTPIVELESIQEEADTRLILHASTQFNTIMFNV